MGFFWEFSGFSAPAARMRGGIFGNFARARGISRKISQKFFGKFQARAARRPCAQKFREISPRGRVERRKIAQPGGISRGRARPRGISAAGAARRAPGGQRNFVAGDTRTSLRGGWWWFSAQRGKLSRAEDHQEIGERSEKSTVGKEREFLGATKKVSLAVGRLCSSTACVGVMWRSMGEGSGTSRGDLSYHAGK